MTSISPDQWARVREVFHAAVEREPADRSAYLTAACGTDDALRAEVERLLAAHLEAADFIERPIARLTGRQIGHYRIGELIGEGGMGEVYEARDTELHRDVALKVGSIGEESRLRREAQYASRLSHPNICTIHEIGVVDGRRYIVMERVEGRQLSEMIPPEGLSMQEVLRYGAQVADAAAHAHRHGVIHRDLKPANIIVTREQRAKVLDFGLSQMLPTERVKAATSAQTAVTRDGMIAGTLSYMAPELLRGEPADERTDIWALGVLLYEMATGTRPFRGATEFELCASILHEPPAPVPRALPAPLHRIIERCLARNPRERYQNASEIKAALEAIERGRIVWPFALPRPFARARTRHRRAALLSLVMVAATIAVAWRVWELSSSKVAIGPSGRPVVAVLPFDDLTAMNDAAWLGKGVQSMLSTGLAQTAALDVVSTQRLYEVVRDIGAQDMESLDHTRAAEAARHAGAGAAVVGSIVRIGSTFRIDAQVEDLSRGRVLAATSVSGTDLFALVDQLAAQIRESVGVRETGAARSIAEMSSTSLEAYRLYSQGVDAFLNFQTDVAQRLLEQAVGVDPTFAEAYLQLASIAGPAGRPGDRRGYLRKAAEYRERLSDRRRLVMEVELARDEGRFPDAVRGLNELIAEFPEDDAISTLAMQLHTPVVGPLPDADRLLDIQRGVVASTPTSAHARNNLAYALLYVGRFDDAIRELETAARLAPRQPGPHDGLGEVYLMMGSPDRALEAFARALTIDPAFPFSRRGRAWTLAVLGRFDEALQERISAPHLTAVVLARVGRFREAGEALSAAVRTAEEGGDDGRLASLHLVSAMLAMERKKYEQALEECVAAERILASVPADRARFIAALAELLHGVTEVRRGRLSDARAHVGAQRRLYPGSPDVWWQRALEGEIALAAGDLDRAETAFSEAAPPRKQFFSALVEGSVLSNDLIFRDGLARVAIARGDAQRAVGIYRQLLSYGPDQKWVAVFEPRYVLEIAKLLERTGDKRGARTEYERVLQLWKGADADLTERSEAQQGLDRTRLR